jgi:hypothetical protein
MLGDQVKDQLLAVLSEALSEVDRRAPGGDRRARPRL